MRKKLAVLCLCACLVLAAGCAPDTAPAPDMISAAHSLEPDPSEEPDSAPSSGTSQLEPEPEEPSSASSQASSSQASQTSSSSSQESSEASSKPSYEVVDLEGRGDDEEEQEDEEEEDEEEDGNDYQEEDREDSGGGEAEEDDSPSGDSGEILSITVGGQEVSGDALDIVSRVVMNEIGDGWPKEAVKAQAVAVYTNIRRQNNSGVSPAFSTRTPSASLKNTISQVVGEMVLYNGKPALTTFFAISAGVTASTKNVWGTGYSYLTSVDSWDEEEYKDYEKITTVSAKDVKRKVESKLKVDLVRGDEDNWFEILDYHDGEYVKTIRVGGEDGVTTTGRNLRENILGLRSTAFDIRYDPGADAFEFTTRGYGHGVGLSQVGAYYCAKNGWDYVEILEYYYPGTQVE